MPNAFDKGWYFAARHLPSPFFNERPEQEISLLVIHNISLPKGQYNTGYIEQLFLGTLDCTCHADFADLHQLQVSSHFLIKRTGELIQFVSTEKRAWHAGLSQFNGRDNCNDFSIGIELEGCDEQAFSPAQYQQLSQLSRALIDNYGIKKSHIVGHSDIAPGRKTDPGPCFDWPYYRSTL